LVLSLRETTKYKQTEKALVKLEKNPHKRNSPWIKSNLQVISSLLDLQAEKFEDAKVRQAFTESQSRVLSMSLIHEKLYKGNENNAPDFSSYLQKLAKNLIKSYSISSKNIRLNAVCKKTYS
jgi:two-component sensor histidine kinase